MLSSALVGCESRVAPTASGPEEIAHAQPPDLSTQSCGKVGRSVRVAARRSRGVQLVAWPGVAAHAGWSRTYRS